MKVRLYLPIPFRKERKEKKEAGELLGPWGPATPSPGWRVRGWLWEDSEGLRQAAVASAAQAPFSGP